MSALGDLHTQNDDLQFSSAEKRKFRKKIPLETDFGAFWMILEKSIFLGPKNPKKAPADQFFGFFFWGGAPKKRNRCNFFSRRDKHMFQPFFFESLEQWEAI